MDDSYDFLRGEVDAAQVATLTANEDGNDSVQTLFATAVENILTGDPADNADEGLVSAIHTLHSDAGVKNPGNSIADQTAVIKAQIEDNIASTKVYD